MASFKISKGLEADLPTIKVDGALYFCTDTGNMYVDYKDGDTISRKLVNQSAFTAVSSSKIDEICGASIIPGSEVRL